MDRTALHLELRNALELADELSRYVHAAGNDTVAGDLRALLTELEELEREVGRAHDVAIPPDAHVLHALVRSAAVLVERQDEVPIVRRARFADLIAALGRVVFALERPGESVPSKPVLGVLPLARVVPTIV